MKRILLPAIMLLLLSFTTNSNTISKTERKYAISKLKDSKKHLQKVLKGLSPAQLNFKASPDSWSVAECTEHIAISENLIYQMFEQVMKQTPDPSRRSEVKVTDDQVYAMITNRTNKVKTQEAFKPTGRYGSIENTLKEFIEKRDSHIDYVKKTDEDLRNRYQEFPFGTIDAYQVIIFLTAHTDRHIAQIEEVIANPNFPKS